MMRSLTSFFLLAVAAPLGAQTASLTISPETPYLVVDEPLDVTVAYTTNIHETQRRGVLLLEVLDAADETVLLRLDDDNGLLGHRGPSGEHTFTVTLDATAPPQVSFRAYLTIYGLNDQMQTHLESYPTDGTYYYQWTGTGVTQDLYYLGGVVILNNSGNATYCSGITYETFLLTYENYLVAQGLGAQIGGMTSTSTMRTFRLLWYGATGVAIEDEYQSTLAIERYGLGFILDDPEDARAGDFIQLWYQGSGGHNCIFQSWGRDLDGAINALNYWSTQPSTSGIGHGSQIVSDTVGIDPARLHIARVMKPRAPDDWSLRFGDTDTLATPTPVLAAPPSGTGLLTR